MMNIKEEIVHFQKVTGVHGDFEHLDPDEWIEKKPERHLGTVVYTTLLVSEILFLWFTVDTV